MYCKILVSQIENLRKEINRESPLRTSSIASSYSEIRKSSSVEKGTPRMEFKLLKTDQEPENRGSTPSNIRKRTATIEKPSVLGSEQKVKPPGEFLYNRKFTGKF